jgi:Domain of unknown function (DUF4190)
VSSSEVPPAPTGSQPQPPTPPAGYQLVYQPPNNGMAVASMVLGILGLIGLVWVISPILALIFGYISKRQIDRSGGRQGGRGMAVAGIVMGWVGIAFSILAIWWFVFVWTRVFPVLENFPENFPTPLPTFT